MDENNLKSIREYQTVANVELDFWRNGIVKFKFDIKDNQEAKNLLPVFRSIETELIRAGFVVQGARINIGCELIDNPSQGKE